MAAPDLRDSIQSALAALATKPLRVAANGLLDTLGYSSDKTIDLGKSDPKTFLDFIHSHSTAGTFDQTKALFAEWKSADLLFQLTDEEISGETTLFKDNEVKPSLFRSYISFAIELTGDNYARGKLTAIARQINCGLPHASHGAHQAPCGQTTGPLHRRHQPPQEQAGRS